MWIVENKTLYEAEGTWVQDKDANKIWMIAVKATFDISPDGSTWLAENQVPVYRQGQPIGEFGESSLKYESDLQGLKVCTDVLVNGNAWARGVKPAAQVDVRLRVGTIDKTLRVFGDRIWKRGLLGNLSISRPIPFESVPITFERAFGGWDRSANKEQNHRVDFRNPIGTGFSLSKKNCEGMRLPNIEYPHRLIKSWRDRPNPAGFNVVDLAWSPRKEYAGTYDEDWKQKRFPLWAIDFDQRYYNCAPADQQYPGFLRGGEQVGLLNLSKQSQITFSLPKIYPVFVTRFGRESVNHRAKLCTVIIEPNIPRVIMVWQTSLVCNHKVDELDVTTVSEKRII